MDTFIEIDTNHFVCKNSRSEGEKGLQIYEYYKENHLVMRLEQIIGDLDNYRELFKLKYYSISSTIYTGLVVRINPSKFKVVINPHDYFRFEWDFNELINKLCVTTAKRNRNGQFVSSVVSVKLLSKRLEDDHSFDASEIYSYTSDDCFLCYCHFVSTESKDHLGTINIGVHDAYNIGISTIPQKLSKLKYLFKTRFFTVSIWKWHSSQLPKRCNYLLFHDDVIFTGHKFDDVQGMDTFLDPTIKLRNHWANQLLKVYQKEGKTTAYKSGVCNRKGEIVIPVIYNLILSCGKYILADSDIFKINKDLSVTQIFHGYRLHFVAIMNGYFVYEKQIKGEVLSFIINSEGKQERIEGVTKLIHESYNGDIIYYDCNFKRFLYKYYEGETIDLPMNDLDELHKDAFEGNPEYEWNTD